jgi:hypothetical protein
MSKARAALLAERARLVERAAHEREDLVVALGEMERPLLAADRTLSFVRAVRRSKWIGAGFGAITAALALVRPNSIVGWVAAGRAVWRVLTRARRSRMAE